MVAREGVQRQVLDRDFCEHVAHKRPKSCVVHELVQPISDVCSVLYYWLLSSFEYLLRHTPNGLLAVRSRNCRHCTMRRRSRTNETEACKLELPTVLV